MYKCFQVFTNLCIKRI